MPITIPYRSQEAETAMLYDLSPEGALQTFPLDVLPAGVTRTMTATITAPFDVETLVLQVTTDSPIRSFSPGTVKPQLGDRMLVAVAVTQTREIVSASCRYSVS